MKETEIINFGCRLNAYESQVMREQAETSGLQNTVIINTCAVTNEAVRQAKQAIRKAHRQNPTANIIVTGCAAQLNANEFADMDEVNRVLGNQEKLRGKNFDRPLEHKVLVGDIMEVAKLSNHLVRGFDGRNRAFVQIQQGCDHRCTFCIIPFSRGPSRSAPISTIVDQIRVLADNGYGEVVLTGVDITAYGRDLPGKPTLGQLIRRLLLAVPTLSRLRLSSVDAVDIDSDLERILIEEERVMPHLHLSLQAGDDLILKRMARRHDRKQAINICNRLRTKRPDMVFGADLIAGFPTETKLQFQNSLSLIDECGLTYLHVFPYSVRHGTPAARMPQVPGEIKRHRASLLREKGALVLASFLATQVGKNLDILLEQPGKGRSEQFALVEFDQATAPTSTGIVNAKIMGSISDRLFGRLTI